MHKTAGRECNGLGFILGHGNTRNGQTQRNIRETQKQAQG